jgi:hypothetical protein
MNKSVYVATSWKNPFQPTIIKELNGLGIKTYDFRNPEEGNTGFRWTDTGMDPHCSNEQYLETLLTPVAEHGFKLDMDALEACSVCLLILPSGRSAHLEAGYAVGAGKKVGILLSKEEVVPELMYKMCDLITDSIEELLLWTHQTLFGSVLLPEVYGPYDEGVEMFDRLSEDEL